jgi:hypothetical protein
MISWKMLGMRTSLMMLLPSLPLAEIYNGTIGIGCNNGSCNFTGVCDSLAVPGADWGLGVYTGITGDVFLAPSTCQAECSDRCAAIAEADPGCIGNAGYVYCPETDSCIRPWEENCPFDGTFFVGPTSISCVNGRCNNLTSTCNVAFGSAVLGGPYLLGLNGEYLFSSDCTATCDGCTGESPPTASPTSAAPTSGSSAIVILPRAFMPIMVYVGWSSIA